MKKTFIVLATSAMLAASATSVSSPAYARDGGAVAAGVIGGLAAGAIIGSAVAPRPYYYGPAPVYVEPEPAVCIERREVWSNRYQAYIVRNVRVPCY